MMSSIKCVSKSVVVTTEYWRLGLNTLAISVLIPGVLLSGLARSSFAGEKERPPYSPLFYQQIAEATYHGEKGQRDHLPDGWHMEQEKEIGTKIGADWHMYLYKNRVTGEHLVGFRGSKDKRDFVSAGTQTDAVAKEMNKTLKKWHKQSGGLTAYVGHSAGGGFASHVDAYGSDDPFRITFNAYNPKARSEKRRIYLRIKSDPVSAPDQSKHIDLICSRKGENPGGLQRIWNPDRPHSIETFGKLLKKARCATWADAFGEKYFDSEASN